MFLQNSLQDIITVMDILVSSNLEKATILRVRCPTRLKSMKLLAETGEYQISEDELSKIKGDFVGYACSDEEAAAIGSCLRDASYVMDTHTAIVSGCIRQVFERWWATTKNGSINRFTYVCGSVLAPPEKKHQR